MYKLILNDYRSNFKNSFKLLWKNGGMFIVMYMVLLSLPDDDSRALHYLGVVLPCVTIYLLSRMYGGYLNKTFFLCPMDAKVRKQYAKESYRIRVLIPTVIFLVINVLLLIFGAFDISIFVVRLLVFGSAAISENIYVQPKYLKEKNKKITPFIGNYETVNILSGLVNILVIIIALAMDEQYTITRMGEWSLIMVVGLLVLQLILTIIKFKRFYWQSIVVMEFYKS